MADIYFNRKVKYTDSIDYRFTIDLTHYPIRIMEYNINYPNIFVLKLYYYEDSSRDLILTKITVNGSEVDYDKNYEKYCFNDVTGSITGNASTQQLSFFDKKQFKCDCGVDSVMGKDSDITFHSSWCKLKSLPYTYNNPNNNDDDSLPF